ncbi:putative ribonuclease H-like domain-containing protein [Tanacetum coccineum]
MISTTTAKVYEHELKGVSNQTLKTLPFFLSTEVMGGTLKQSTAEPSHIPKGYTQAYHELRLLKIQTQNPLLANNNNEDIELDPRKFDAEPVTYAMMALTGVEQGNPEEDLKDYAIIDSGCSGSMTGDKDKLWMKSQEKGTFKTSARFEKVSYVEELKFNLLSVSQICDKKHNVLFTDKECLILSPKFKFVDEDLVILRAPRKNDVYSLDLKNIIPSGGITCLVAKATEDEAVLWHRRLGHKVKHTGHLARRLRKELTENLLMLHMDLFGPVSVESINKKKNCLVVTDDCSKFSWVFFLAYKDETYDMLHDLIVGLENRLRHKVGRPSV